MTDQYMKMTSAAYAKLHSLDDSGLSAAYLQGEGKETLAEAMNLYQMALGLPTNDTECNLGCHRELYIAYQKMGALAQLKQMQLYFFDNELESMHAIIYLAGAESKEGRAIVPHGSTQFSRLRLILRNESSEIKTLYLEKCFTKMNQASVWFKLKVSWGISKGYYKQMLKKVDLFEMKAAHKLC